MKSIALRQWEAAAYAAGRLTQIRRVCRPQPEVGRYGNGEIIGKFKNQIGGGDYHIWKSKILGTIPLTTDCIYQLHRTSPYGAPGDTLALREGARMPLSAVRWHPVITAVRLERVQDMTIQDSMACGITHPFSFVTTYPAQFTRDNPRTPWDNNPWVWVYEVEGVKS